MSDCMNIINEFDAHVALEDLTCNETCEDIVSLGEYIINEMSEFSNYCDDPYLMEATKTSTTSTQSEKKQNIFQKVLGYIKKFFAFLAKIFRWLINKVFKRKLKTTPDQVAEKVIGASQVTSNGEVKSAETDKQQTSQPNSTTQQSSNNSAKSGKKSIIKTTSVHFKAAPGSVLKERDINLIQKNLMIKIENNEYVVGLLHGFSGSDAENLIGAHKPDSVNNNIKLRMALQYITNTNGYADALDKVVDDLISLSNNKGVSFETLRNSFDKFMQIKITNFNYKLSGESLRKRFELINTLNQRIRNITEIPDNPEYNKLLKNIVGVMSNMTMGLNSITREFGYMFMIDERYLHTISDVEKLAQFVDGLITSGVPTSYVAYNCWCVMDEDFDDRGYFYNSDGDKAPRWGQTRVVFLPTIDTKSVLKVAMNGAGEVGNQTEIKRYQMYNSKDLANVLCKPLKSYHKNTIVSYDRVRTIEDKQAEPIIKQGMDSFVENLKEKSKEKGLPEIGDLHDGNIGLTNDNKLVVIDYAL